MPDRSLCRPKVAAGPRWRGGQERCRHCESAVATPLSDVESTVSRLIWLQVGIGGGVVVVIGVLSYLLVRASLRPLRRVEETAHAIADGNLNAGAAGPDEHGKWAACLRR